MNVVIIEDEEIAARRLTRLLKQVEPDINIITVLPCVELAVQWFTQNPAPDLAFFDIQLTDGTSFDIFNQITVPCPVIFCTAYDEYAIQAFKVNSVDYLLKPLQPEALEFALQQFKKQSQNNDLNQQLQTLVASLTQQQKAQQQKAQPPTAKAQKERFLVKVGRKFISITLSEIAYFYSQLKITQLMTFEGRSYVLDESLDDIEQQLNTADFFRISRQFIVHIDAVKSTTSSEKRLYLELAPEMKDEVMVSRDKNVAFKQWLGA
ncbi:MAG: LytTR family DNA-binding domain-containing protein [Psychrosphaera sp.]|nr:LytTR family DNA-binding domain-containing protein [Psychrosphaera sp.]